MTEYAIIGDGGAGTTAAFYIRQADPKARIVIYSDDPNAAYYRAALTNYLIGELRESQLFATPPDFYQKNDIQRSLGRVTALDAKNSRFTFDDGNRSAQVGYDQLLIAAGASPNPPNFPGSGLPGVMTMRTMQDARTVMDQISAKRLRQAVVVGGGPLGIEWVQGLLHHHVRVIYLLRGDTFFGNALDRTGSDLVISRLRSEGVDVRTNEEIVEAIAGRDGRIRAVKLKNSGQEVECQLVGAAIGISPNVAFLKDSGIEIPVDPKRGTPQGIKVDEAMRTNFPNVYAAGDIIHRTMGLWEPARLQGRVAGRNMAGGSATYKQGVHYNATRLYDLDYAGAGESVEKPGDQVLIDFPKGSGRVAYRKLIVRDGKLVGAIMLGQRKEGVRKYGMHYRNLIDQKVDVSSVANDLLDPSFDLAAWMDSREIGDQIESARRIDNLSNVPSNASMRMTTSALSMNLPRPSGIMQATQEEAALLHGGNRVPIKGGLSIGRLLENDLVLNDPDVSSRHARIQPDGSGFVLEDLRSTNGTYLNGKKISAPAQLSGGALISVGGVKIQFVSGATAPTQNLRMTSAGLPEVEAAPPALPSDPVWGYLQVGNRDISLQMTALNLGRDVNADIHVDDQAVSYKHAHLVRQGSDSYLLDLGSRNGTFVNGERISVPQRLQSGDTIKLGNTTLTYRTGSTPAPKREPAPVRSEPPRLVEAATPVHEPVKVAPVRDATMPSAEPSPLVWSLTARSGPLSGKTFPLDRSPLTVGRDPASHIVMDDGTVSWRHAMFKQEDMAWNIRDLNSRNRTFLNDSPLEPEKPYPLKRGDRVRIGETTLEVT